MSFPPRAVAVLRDREFATQANSGLDFDATDA